MTPQNLLGQTETSPAGPGRERRIDPREAPSQGLAAILQTRDTDTIPAVVLNLSMSGLALQTWHPHPTGTVLTVSLTNASRLFCCTRLIVVRYCRALPSDGYLAGCEFVSKLDSGQLRALVDSSDLSTFIGRLGFLGDR